MKTKGMSIYDWNNPTVMDLRTDNEKLQLECEKYQARERELSEKLEERDKALAEGETDIKSLNKDLQDAAVNIDEVFADLEAAKTKLTRIQRERNDGTIQNLRAENEKLQLECVKYQARERELSEKLDERDKALAAAETNIKSLNKDLQDAAVNIDAVSVELETAKTKLTRIQGERNDGEGTFERQTRLLNHAFVTFVLEHASLAREGNQMPFNVQERDLLQRNLLLQKILEGSVASALASQPMPAVMTRVESTPWSQPPHTVTQSASQVDDQSTVANSMLEFFTPVKRTKPTAASKWLNLR